MKSAASSVASDDTMEAGSVASAKDQLDFAVDFPPLVNGLATSEAGPTPVDDLYVPKWVNKVTSNMLNSDNNKNKQEKQQQQQNNASSDNTSFSTDKAVIVDSSDTKPVQEGNIKISEGKEAIHNETTEFDTKSGQDQSNIEATNHSTAAVPAADLPTPAPPPDVTVVPQGNNSQQCTAVAGLLPDIAAQAPNVMNTTNR